MRDWPGMKCAKTPKPQNPYQFKLYCKYLIMEYKDKEEQNLKMEDSDQIEEKKDYGINLKPDSDDAIAQLPTITNLKVNRYYLAML